VKTKIEKINEPFFLLISQHTKSHSLQEELEGYYFPPVGPSRLQCQAFLVLPIFPNIQLMDSELHMEVPLQMQHDDQISIPTEVVASWRIPSLFVQPNYNLITNKVASIIVCLTYRLLHGPRKPAL
jgi:hypothetical protein